MLIALLTLTWLAEGLGGRLHPRGAIAASPRPPAVVEARRARQALEWDEGAGARQVLFGDLHVHTTYSGDAFVFSLPLFQGEGVHPPADACDFARFCSGLDFYSINDHAEHLTPRQWDETRESIRACNAVADPADPDLVAFLGWEWTQSSPDGHRTGRAHYGHKNVVFLDTADDRVPTRPIGAGSGGLFARDVPAAAWATVRFGMALRDLGALRPYLDFNAFTREFRGLERCAEDVPVRDLPSDCVEGASTPGALFRKLDEWGFPSLVIPHGTSWGIHAPPGADLATQLSIADHDPARQRLFEVYSGHGSSEVRRPMRDTLPGDGEGPGCAPPADGYLPCCWRAGEIVRERCDAETPADVCEARVERTRRLAARSGAPYGVVPGTTPADWLECGQLPDGFLPAFAYRPGMSAQQGLALRSDDGATYRFGLIGSSDNHKARAGPGYKERFRKAYGDAYGFRRDWYDAIRPAAEASPEPLDAPSLREELALGFERGASYYYTSGLVAVHARERSREAIWEALTARRAYGTSGPRILLDFSLVNAPGGPAPMGAEVEMAGPRAFTVRAVGSFEQRPGCPADVAERLGAERVARLCLGECHYPSDVRHPIERIEVVRIRKQHGPGDPLDELVEDPWQTLSCDGSRDGCVVRFEDERPDERRETVYYVRALQSPTPAVNGDPVRCERDAEGRCVRARPCPASGPDFEPADDCLSPVAERAWSSPIFVRTPARAASR